MGEAKRREELATDRVTESVGLEIVGGRLQVRWDDSAAATVHGEMAFFIEFLTVSGLFNRWVADCPFSYQSPNGSESRDVLGTWLLSILSGHWRYAHIAALRSDGVNPNLLGMRKVVSDDTLRRALSALDEIPAIAWLNEHLKYTTAPLLTTPWILDTDVTIKPIYGKQEGAVVGYNPKKPGRPSHAYHTYQVSGLRLMLGVDVLAGNETHVNHTLPGLFSILDSLTADRRPYLVRGDAGMGGESAYHGLEERKTNYLFKLRLTKNVKRHIERVAFSDGWVDAGQGWQGKDGQLILDGWRRTRRVIVLRRCLKGEMALSDSTQQTLAFIESDKPIKGYEYAVLVTDLPHEVVSIAQLYRDRADSENTFDELKNQWGWSGFTTKDLKRCRLSAMAVALVYNWWSLFVRLGSPDARREAITSRPLLLSAVARRTSHAGQQQLTITPQHGDANKAKSMFANIHALLQRIKQHAEQLPCQSIWQLICDHIAATVGRLRASINAAMPPPKPPLLAG
jgi:hypothetical protein